MMVQNMRVVSLVVFLIIAGCRAEGYDPEKQFTVEQLNQDFELLKRALKRTHAGLNRYVDPKVTEDLFAQISAKLNRPMTEREFYREVTLLSSVIDCGHTRFGRSAEFRSWQDEHERYLPVHLRILGGRAYVQYDGTIDSRLPEGAEILRINGRAMPSLIEEMILHIPGDGTIRTGRIKALEENFPVLYKDLIDQPQEYLVELVRLDGLFRRVHVRPMTPSESDKVGRARYPELSEPLPPALSLEIRKSPRVAVLTIRSFGSRVKDAAGDGYNAFLEKSFNRLRKEKISNLIVDLRGNGGGNDEYGSRLFSYLTDQYFEYYDHLGVVVELIDFLEHTSLDKDFNETIKEWVEVDDQGRRLAVGHPNLQTQEPREPGFQGPVIFLVDRGSFSATAELAAVAHHNHRGLFIGEETGGGYHGNTSGMGYVLTLPNTKLRINIPMIKYVSAVSGNPFKSRGIIPDYRVLPTIEDVLSGEDPVMEFALEQTKSR